MAHSSHCRERQRQSSSIHESQSLKALSSDEESDVVRTSASSVSGHRNQRRGLRVSPSSQSLANTRSSFSQSSRKWSSKSTGFMLLARIGLLLFIALHFTRQGDLITREQLDTSASAPYALSAPVSRRRMGGNETTTPRFLWGIFSTLQPREASRRQVIRRSYLATDPDRICSLKDLPRKPHCQLVYTFVVGANFTGPTDLIDYQQQLVEAGSDEQHSLTVDSSEMKLANGSFVPREDDITYLNIKDNMEDGKSPSWFKYANSLVEDHSIDYIAKVDSDTLLFPDRFLDDFAAFLPQKRPGNSELLVYGGVPNDSIGCGGLRRSHCGLMAGKTYMEGQMHFLSADLSHYVANIPRKQRQQLFVRIEDLCTGNYVHSHPKPVFEAVISRYHHLWEHGHQIKDPDGFEQRWNELRQTNLRIGHADRSTG